MKAVRVITGTALPLRRPTSTPTRSSPPSGSSASNAPATRRACSRRGATTATSCSTTSASPVPACSSPEPAFGVGSSREHAVWALQQYGFDAVIAPSFSDIFRNNCTKNGLVPVVLPESVVERLWDAIEADPGTTIVVDVERLTVEVPSIGLDVPFDLDRGDAAALPRGPRRHRHHAGPRGRHHPLRSGPPRLADVTRPRRPPPTTQPRSQMHRIGAVRVCRTLRGGELSRRRRRPRCRRRPRRGSPRGRAAARRC